MAYKLTFTGGKEARLAAKLKAELYSNSFPELTYRVLNKDSTIIDPTYGDSRRVDRVYVNYPMHLNPVYNPVDMGLSAFGIDLKRQILFLGATFAFDDLGISPKQGDEIVWEGDHYEIATYKPHLESEVAKTNFFTEIELVANIPPQDLRSNNV